MMLRPFIGIAAFVASLYFVYKVLKTKKAIGLYSDCKLTSTIVENEAQIVGVGSCLFFPVYEYEMDGEVKRYKGTYPTVSPLNIGTQITMYYNHGTRTVIDPTVITAETTIAMVCGLLAIIMLNV